ncbi:hypothetical protein AAMO2058_000332400 [Amorphochlora amoebiformis]
MTTAMRTFAPAFAALGIVLLGLYVLQGQNGAITVSRPRLGAGVVGLRNTSPSLAVGMRTRFVPGRGKTGAWCDVGHKLIGGGCASQGHVSSQKTQSGVVCNALPGQAVVASIVCKEEGEFGTEDFKLNFEADSNPISPWHNIPLSAGEGLYNMVTEIPKMTKAKMEIDTKSENNPIKQDVKKGNVRYYHGPIFWNYGCLPQTWEDPNIKGDDNVGGAFGDNDPLDVVEIGSASLAMGSVTAVKPLGVLSMIDDGELDWKLIAINAKDPKASEINDIDDIEKHYPGTVSGIREWFRWYKTPDDKPVNSFGHGEKALPKADALKVIEETHKHYNDMMEGKSDKGKLWTPAAVAA